MSRKALHYEARLFRGWEMVNLRYAVEGEEVVLHRKSTWKGEQEQRVAIGSLTGEIRRVWGRQPAYLVSTIVTLAALLVLGIDAMMHGVGAGGRGVYWPLWWPLLAVVLVAGTIRARVRKSAEWTHFTGNNQGAGLYVLKDPRNAQAHQHFVEMVKKRIG